MKTVSPRFVGCEHTAATAHVLLFGVPFEGHVNFKPGAVNGPRDIRAASDDIETYSPWLKRDLSDAAVADIGDCELPPEKTPREQLDAARLDIARMWRPGLGSFMLGGDHTSTLPVVEMIAREISDLSVLHLDAHVDMHDVFLGERFTYASVMARLMEIVPPSRVYQVGMRSGTRDEFEKVRSHFFPVFAGHPVEIVRSLLPALKTSPLYVTIDIDVLDASVAPGTGSPEPGGLRLLELVEILHMLGGCDVVGGDLVEVAQGWDHTTRTAIAAGWIVREALLSWW